MKKSNLAFSVAICAALASGAALAEDVAAAAGANAGVAANETPAAQPKPRQARSVHLNFDPVAPDATEARGTVTVTESHPNSYFMIVGCDGAYCGVQELLGGGRIFIFSVWDPGDQFDPAAHPDEVPRNVRAEVISANPKTEVSRFGGEGTGAKTITSVDWKVGEPVSAWLVVKPFNDERTVYSCRIKVGDGGEWEEIATITTIGKRKGVGYINSFVEDFWRNGYSATLTRRAEFRGYETRAGDKDEWKPCTKAQFTADSTPLMSIDAGKTPTGAMFLQTGGDTKNINTPLWGNVYL